MPLTELRMTITYYAPITLLRTCYAPITDLLRTYYHITHLLCTYYATVTHLLRTYYGGYAGVTQFFFLIAQVPNGGP